MKCNGCGNLLYEAFTGICKCGVSGENCRRTIPGGLGAPIVPDGECPGYASCWGK